MLFLRTRWLVKSLVMFFLIIWLGHPASAATEEAEGTPTLRLPEIEGVVLAVTEDGFMMVSPSGGEADDIEKVREWGYQVEPLALELAVLGRKVRCGILVKTDDYHIAACTIKFFDAFKDTPYVRGWPNITSGVETGIAVKLNLLGIGSYFCSEKDRRYIPQFPIQRIGDPKRLLERCD